MCGICGYANFKKDISNEIDTIKKMNLTLSKRGPDDNGLFTAKHVLLGHRRLTVVDPEGGKQPMIKKFRNNNYVIIYNGELYNTDELRNFLIKEGYTFKSYSDTEVLLTSYIHFGIDCLKHINGIYAFAIWDEKEKRLFLARDPLGVKPLFYTINDNSLIFGSEIKTVLAHPSVKPAIDREGLTNLFALGPGRALGNAIFKDIKEIPPAHFILFNSNGLKLKEYWDVSCEENKESADEAADHVRSLLTDAIKRQLVSDVPICTFLSGGLDSSIISYVASKEFNKNGKILNTYSIDYENNSAYFKSNIFQPTYDSEWALKMAKFIGSNHHNIINNNIELAKALYNAVIANDIPGMADIDSSLYLFCREIKKKHTVAISGECADEIFGGYPWFTRPELVNADTFPWSRSVDERKKLLNKNLQSLGIEECTRENYKKTLKKVPHMDGESKMEYRQRELFYLNIKWFMLTLLTRKDRMSMSNSLEVRVPFADYRLVQYAFNIPSSIKLYEGREKGLLRKAFKGILPDDIVERKKSPYPKTYSPQYSKFVVNWLHKILADKTSPILEIVDFNTIKNIADTAGAYFKTPWYGQLMTGPQLIAYLIQINIWLKEYNIDLQL